MTRLRFNLILILLLGLLAFFQYRLWIKVGGVQDIWQLKQAVLQKTAENEKLKASNETLLFQIARLKHGQDTFESRARNELGMVKEGETFYQIVKDSRTTHPKSTDDMRK